ncbi:tape measure protein [Methylococcaceae bacterium WWC4]|nr:tape measure protein [Methylococcaceae bacterium WWC4]
MNNGDIKLGIKLSMDGGKVVSGEVRLVKGDIEQLDQAIEKHVKTTQRSTDAINQQAAAAKSAKIHVDAMTAALSKSPSLGAIKMTAGLNQAGKDAAEARRQIEQTAASSAKASQTYQAMVAKLTLSASAYRAQQLAAEGLNAAQIANIQTLEKQAAINSRASESFSTLRASIASVIVVAAAFDAGRELVSVSARYDSINRSLEATTKSAAEAANSLSFVNDTAWRLGAGLQATSRSFANVQASAAGTILEGEPARKIFLAIEEAMSKLGKTSDETDGALLAIGQMMSKSTIAAEELRGQLAERLPGAFQLMAKAVGVSTAELSKMLEQGEVGIDVLPRFAEELNKAYSNGNFNGIENNIQRIKNAWDQFVVSAANALNIAGKLQTLAQAVTPDSPDQIRARLGVQLNGIDGSGGLARMQYWWKTASLTNPTGASLGADRGAYAQLTRNKVAADLSSAFDFSPLGKELDTLVSDAKRQGNEYQTVTKGIADATQRLWDENRKSIEEREKAQKSAADTAAKAYKAEREEVAKTLAAIQQETSLIGLSDKERERAIELNNALAKAKGNERAAIEQALAVKWQELDADQRRNEMWAESVRQANALDELRDSAAEAQRLAQLAEQLKLQGATNEQIARRIDLEKQLQSARAAAPDADPATVAAYVQTRTDAELQLSKLTDVSTKHSADYFETAYKRSIENVQDALGQMFESVFDGTATGSFQDFLTNIASSINKVFAQQMALNFQRMLSQSFTNGAGGAAGSSGGVGGLFSSMFGSSGSSGGGFGSFFSSIFSSGPFSQGGVDPFGANENGRIVSPVPGSASYGSGPWAVSSANGGGMAYSMLGSLLSMLPGGSQFRMAGSRGRNAQLETLVGIENQVSNMIGNFFPFAKLIAPIKNMALNLGASLFSDRKPSTLGHMIGQSGGPLQDMLLTFLMGSKIPEPTQWTKGAYSGGKISITKSGQEEGGDPKITNSVTTEFGKVVKSLGSSLRMNIDDFRSMFWSQLTEKNQQLTAGYLSDNAGTFFRQTPSGEDNLAGLANKMALSVVKRNIGNQDDLHYRTAIRDSKRLKQLNEAIAEIDNIGITLGEYGPVLTQLKALNAQFDDMANTAAKYRFSEAQVEAARQRAIDALKNDTLTSYRNLAGMGASLNAQLGSLADTLIELESNAKTLKIAEADLLGLREKAIANARATYLAPLTDATASIADQLSSLTGVLPTPEDTAPLYDLLAKSTDPTEQANYIARIQKALTQRYNVEIAAINKTQTAVYSLRDLIDGLKLGDLSTLTPEQKLAEAKSQYGKTLLKAQAGDQTSLSALAGDAQDYLTAAKTYFASTSDYAAIFDNVTTNLEALSVQFGGTTDASTAAEQATAAATASANSLATSLTSLKTVVDGLAAARGAAYDQQAATTSAAVTAAQTGPTKNRVDTLENQKQANIAGLAANASKADKSAVTRANQYIDAQIKAFNFGGDTEADKTVKYQSLTDQIAAVNAQIKSTKDKTAKANLVAQRDGLTAQRKALGAVKYKFKADGGWTQGPTIVGENGPELINFAHPTMVTNNRQTQAVIGAGNDAMIAELRKQTEELQALVRLQQAANAALLDQLKQSNTALAETARKARLESAA